MYIVLSNGVRVEDCVNGTTSDYIVHSGETSSEAASILDVLTPQNTGTITVFSDEDVKVDFSSDLVLLPGGEIEDRGDYKVCIVKLRHKTEIEKMHEEIAELQEVIIEEE